VRGLGVPGATARGEEGEGEGEDEEDYLCDLADPPCAESREEKRHKRWLHKFCICKGMYIQSVT